MILKPTESPNRGIIPKRLWICAPIFIEKVEDLRLAHDRGRQNVEHAARERKCSIGPIDFRRNTDGSVAHFPIPGFNKAGLPSPGADGPPPGNLMMEALDGSGRRFYSGPLASPSQTNGYLVFVQAQVFREG